MLVDYIAIFVVFCVFFFKQKTAYEMRISDWSSDVCSSDLAGGILVTQNGVPAVQGSEVTNSYRRLGESFADVGFYVAAIPTYQGGLMAMGWASDDPAKRRHDAATHEARFAPPGIAPRYYPPANHHALGRAAGRAKRVH